MAKPVTRTLWLFTALVLSLAVFAVTHRRNKDALADRPGDDAPRSNDEVRRQREARQTPIAEISPSAATEPLVGADGLDEDGYPRKHVDRAVLRAMLRARRFAELTKLVESFQDAFEKDPRYEYWPIGAAGAFKSAEPDLVPLINAWVSASPTSFAPYLCRGAYRTSVAYARRGGAWAKDTAEADFAAMKGAMAFAIPDLDEALRRRPRLVAALDEKIAALKAMSSRAEVDKVGALAIGLCPTCVAPRVSWLEALEPRWGGSYERMLALVSAAPVARNRKLRFLPGYIDLDKAHAFVIDNKLDEALAAAERACALGDFVPFLFQRADIEERKHDLVAARKDVERVLARSPDDEAGLVLRARIRLAQKDYEGAGRDLIAGLRNDPTNAHARPLRDPIVKGLTWQAGRYYHDGKQEEALRVYELALSLDPDNREAHGHQAYALLHPAGAPVDPATAGGAPSELDRARQQAAAAPDDLRVHQRLDYLLAQQRRFDDVIAMWTEYLGRHPDDGTAHLERGGAYFQLGRRAEAGEDAKKACDLGVSEGCARARMVR